MQQELKGTFEKAKFGNDAQSSLHATFMETSTGIEPRMDLAFRLPRPVPVSTPK